MRALKRPFDAPSAPVFKAAVLQWSFPTQPHSSRYPKSFEALVGSLGRLRKCTATLAAPGAPRSWRVVALGAEMGSVPINPYR